MHQKYNIIRKIITFLTDIANKTFNYEIWNSIKLQVNEEDTMKRLLSILIVLIVTSLLSGCIISHSQKEDPVILTSGVAKTFIVKVFPTPSEYNWYVDVNQLFISTAESTSSIRTGLILGLWLIVIGFGIRKFWKNKSLPPSPPFL
jgi:hypothetical protein